MPSLFRLNYCGDDIILLMQIHSWEILPKPFLERLRVIISPESQAEVFSTFCSERPISFRANTLKISTADLQKELIKRNIFFHPVAWSLDAFVLDKKVGKEILVESDLYTNGFIYIQSLSSMIPTLVLTPKKDELICDLTAAPGSKTTQIAMLMQNTGKIVANDISRARMFKLKANLETQGVTNTETSLMPGQALWKRYPEFFDKVLVDVPCTLEGRFSCNDPKSYKDWTPKKVKILSQLQKFLLRSAVSLTKPGGVIVYSTCTFEPEENESVVDWVLKKEGDALRIEEIDLPVSGLQQGLVTWNKKVFDSNISKTIRVLPSNTMEGFYVAKIRKLSSTLSL